MSGWLRMCRKTRDSIVSINALSKSSMEVHKEDDMPCDLVSDQRLEVSWWEMYSQKEVETRPYLESIRLINKHNKRKPLRTWNFQTLFQAGKLRNMILEIQTMNLNILETCEIWWLGNRQLGAEGVMPTTDMEWSSSCHDAWSSMSSTSYHSRNVACFSN